MIKNLFALCLALSFAWMANAQESTKTYYPLKEGQAKAYQVSHYATTDKQRYNIDKMLTIDHERNYLGQDLVLHKVSGTKEMAGITYTTIVDNLKKPVELIRESSGSFFRYKEGGEECFLKANQEVGATWYAFKDEAKKTLKRAYQIYEKYPTIKIRGIDYQDVICTRKVTLRPSEDGKTQELQDYGVYYFYAAGKGLVYSYEPYPLGGTYTDVEHFIME